MTETKTVKKTPVKKPAAKKTEAKQVTCINCIFHSYVAAANFHTCTRWNRYLEHDEVEKGYCHRAVAAK